MKKLYYEVLPPDEHDKPETDEYSAQSGSEKTNQIIEVEPSAKAAERDRFLEFTAAVKKIKRVRFRVEKQTNNKQALTLILTLAVLVGGIFLMIIKSRVGQITVGAVMLGFIVVCIGIMIAQTVKARVPRYCYFAADERGVFCVSDMGDSATVYAYGTAYRINGDEFYTLDGGAYRDFLDGEGSGMLSLLSAKRADVEFEDDETLNCFVKNRIGGGHAVFFDGDSISSIESSQPSYTGETDPATGERKVKLDVFIKTEPTENFAWEISDRIKSAFDANGVSLPDMDGL